MRLAFPRIDDRLELGIIKEVRVSRKDFCFAAVCGILALVSTGCGNSGPKLYPATGTVTFEGKPLADATVLFVPQGGRPSLAVTDAEGKYSITTGGKPGAPAGTYGVAVSKSAALGAGGGGQSSSLPGTPTDTMSSEEINKMQEQMAQSTQQMMRGSNQPAKSAIPAKYAIPEGSGLSAVVTADASKNVFNLELTP